MSSEALERRVRTLEKRVWIVAAAGTLPWIAAGAAFLAFDASRVTWPGVVRANGFEVVGPEDRAIVRLGAAAGGVGGGAVRVLGPAGKEGLYLGMQPGSAGNLTLRDGAGKPVVVIGNSEKGGGFLDLNLDAAVPLAHLGAARDGISSLKVFARDGTELAHVGPSQRRHGALILRSSDGREVVSAGVDDDDETFLLVRGSREKTGVCLYGQAPGGAVAVYDAMERTVGRLGWVRDGGGLRVNGADGEPRFYGGVDEDDNGVLHVHRADGTLAAKEPRD